MYPSQRQICPVTAAGSLKLLAAHIKKTVYASTVSAQALAFKSLNSYMQHTLGEWTNASVWTPSIVSEALLMQRSWFQDTRRHD